MFGGHYPISAPHRHIPDVTDTWQANRVRRLLSSTDWPPGAHTPGYLSLICDSQPAEVSGCL